MTAAILFATLGWVTITQTPSAILAALLGSSLFGHRRGRRCRWSRGWLHAVNPGNLIRPGQSYGIGETEVWTGHLVHFCDGVDETLSGLRQEVFHQCSFIKTAFPHAAVKMKNSRIATAVHLLADAALTKNSRSPVNLVRYPLGVAERGAKKRTVSAGIAITCAQLGIESGSVASRANSICKFPKYECFARCKEGKWWHWCKGR